MSDDSDHKEDIPTSTAAFSFMFCDPTADVVFESSDHVQYRLHSKSLAITAGALAVPDAVVVDGDPVKLDEPSEVLDILFQFIEPPTEARNFRYPSIVDVKPEALFPLAEAAEKYMVFPAMSSCVTAMHLLTSSHALEVTNHAYKHGYTDLLNKAAPKTFVPIDLNSAAKVLTAPGLLSKWLRYYAKLRDVSAIGERWFAYYKGQQHTKSCVRFSDLRVAFNNRCRDYPGDPLSFRNDIAVENNCSSEYNSCVCRLDQFPKISVAMAALPSFDET